MKPEKLAIKGFSREDPSHITAFWWMGLVLLLVILLVAFSISGVSDVEKEIVLVIGLIGAWRYGWKLIHLVRGVFYQYIRYPILKVMAESSKKPTEVLIVIPCYRTCPEISAPVFKALIDDIERFGVACRVVACVTDVADIAVIERQFEQVASSTPLNLHVIWQDGSGKRGTMADALTLLAEEKEVSKDSILILMDGDTVIPEGTLEKVSGFLMRFHDLGAVTTHNQATVKGSSITRQWYRQRMSLRHFYMCSLSLSYRVLVLTGRFSAFRASLALSSDFIENLRYDYIKHWRYGQIRLLTGDDKSTWFYVLKNQWKMLYLPDWKVTCMEEEPTHNFFTTSVQLMTRWYGNMLRSNLRALSLSPQRLGWFLWLCLWDQRISMWTTLIGPTLALVASLYLGPSMFVAYLIWVIVSRGLNVLLISIQSGVFHPIFVVLLWYEQVFGSLIKIYLFFHPNLQNWTRQNISSNYVDHSFTGEVKRWLPHVETTAALLTLFVAVMALYF
ncbi:glycosyltransferase family 2 protein [Parasalinivibrio latis]|uniref:glycosyltransferase n=1 Tax=Parasalinivibrio latis TaxID=2952610 RepID=UPI0030DFCB5E